MYARADILHAPFWMYKQARDEKDNELLIVVPLLLFIIHESEFQASIRGQCTEVVHPLSTCQGLEMLLIRLQQFSYQNGRGLTRYLGGNRLG
jgi:hypothetical protein